MAAPKLDLVFWNGLSIRGNKGSAFTEKKSNLRDGVNPGDSSDLKKRINSMLEYLVRLDFEKLFSPPTTIGPDLIIIGEVYPDDRFKNLEAQEEGLITDLKIRRHYKARLYPMNKGKEHFLVVYKFETLKIEAAQDPIYSGVLQITAHMLAANKKNVTGFYKILAVHLPNSNKARHKRVFTRLGPNQEDYHLLIGDTNMATNSNLLSQEKQIAQAILAGGKNIKIAGRAGISRKELKEFMEDAPVVDENNNGIPLRTGVKELLIGDVESTSLSSGDNRIDRVWHIKRLQAVGRYLGYGPPEKKIKECGEIKTQLPRFSQSLSAGDALRLINPKDKQAQSLDDHGIKLSKKGVELLNFLLNKGSDYLHYLFGLNEEEVLILDELANTTSFTKESMRVIKKLKVKNQMAPIEKEAVLYLQHFKVHTSFLSDHRPIVVRVYS